MGCKVIFIDKVKRDNWECYKWIAHLGSETVEYYTGLGHATKGKGSIGLKPHSLTRKVVASYNERNERIYIHVPKIKDILYSLAMDAQCGQETFEDFCANFGYSTDSRKALETYLACQDANTKLRKIMKSKNYLERILAWEL